MANFKQALDITKRLARADLEYDQIAGTASRFGITHTLLRKLFDPTRQGPPQPNELHMLESFTAATAASLYRKSVWDECNLGAINDEDLAAEIFNLCCELGPGGWRRKDGRLEIESGGVVILQQALNVVRGRSLLAIDGVMGFSTVEEINRTNAGALLAEVRRLARRNK